MLAKCATCKHVFSTDHYGSNLCPACGAELMLSAPAGSEPQPPSSGQPSEGSAEPQGEPAGWEAAPAPAGGAGGYGFAAAALEGEATGPTPWEERATRGLLPAWFETVKRSFVDPVNFFGKMRVDNMDGAISFYWINTAIGSLLGYFWQSLTALAGMGMNSAQQLDLPAGHPMAGWMELQSNPFSTMAIGVVIAALAPLWLFITAGIYHLGAMIFKSADNGFNATVRSVAYASGPGLLAVVPFCGAAIGGLWSLVLVVIGIWKTQRSSVGAAIGAVAVPIVVLACCLCAGIGAAAAVGGFAAASMMGGAGN